MGHRGAIDDKIKAIELIDREVIGRLLAHSGDGMRVMVMPDHPTPIKLKTHCDEPVPFLIWGSGIVASGARRFTENEAAKTGNMIDPGYKLMAKFITNPV
jgi:2,3-bisphosphoglycerate-independent phosphoglycerate mutase